MYKRVCKICGKEFETRYYRRKCCSPECSKVNAREITRIWNSIHHTEWWRNKNNGKVLCKICGKPIFRIEGRRSTAQMHDECVFNQCKDVLKAGKKLNGMQGQRLAARGYTIREFKEDFLNE